MLDARLNIPKPEGLDYYQFQEEGIRFLNGKRNALLADDTGIGKTIEVSGFLNLHPEYRSILIVCPAVVKLNWKNEIEKWSTGYRSIGVIMPGDEFPMNSEVVIMNYDILGRYQKELRIRTWDVIVCDEAHYLKSGRKIQRGQNIYGKWDKLTCNWETTPLRATRIFFLSGTPFENRPIELWPMLNFLDRRNWNNWRSYVERFCDGWQNRFGWQVKGASNLEELNQRLRETIMLRRLKSEVLPELPTKFRQIIEVSIDNIKGQIELKKRFREWNKDDPEFREAIEQLEQGIDPEFETLAQMRRATALAKVPFVVEHVQNIIESGKKVVVFAYHKDVIALIAKALEKYGVVVITGDTGVSDREKRVERFQNDPNCMALVGNIKAAGVGITLTAASNVVIAELTFVPSDLTQAEDRCVRIGQKSNVLVQHIVFEKSLDAMMAKMVVRKQEILDKTLNRR